MIYSIFPSVL